MRHPASIVLLSLIVFAAAGCKTMSGTQAKIWPQIDALPDAPPTDLERDAPTSVLRQGTDGFTYIVGGLPNDVASGGAFLARYSGDWPLSDLPRPPLASGWVLKRYDGDVALVSLDYVMPDAELEGLEVTWETGEQAEDLGKGLSRVSVLSPTEGSDLGLSVGSEIGVQPGDIYAVLEPVNRVDDAASLQLARRLLGICLVDTVEVEASTCRLWRGSAMVPGKRPIAVGDQAVFLEHTYGRAPRRSVIEVGKVKGAKNDAIQKMLVDTMRLYTESFPLPKTAVEPVDREFDATELDFHRYGEDVDYDGFAKLIVGATVVQRDGVDHLIVNYTGAGPAVGPGMVAAPPEQGVDLGPVEDLETADIRAFTGIVWAGVLVYRGQTSEALMHLHLVLNDPTVQGPLRWHGRDQYAMRWAALGFLQHALWLVMEDEAVAQRTENRKAYLNALGTRVRLMDLLDRPAAALSASSEYLDARAASDKGNTAHLAALGMHVEMLLARDEVEAARATISQMEAICPDGCEGELGSMLSGAYWASPEGEDDFRNALLAEIIDLAQEGPASQLASARTYQGLAALRDERFEDALIAFHEAERLYTEGSNLAGIARIKYFMFLTQLNRQELQAAFELAVEAIERDRELGDFVAASRTYERLATLYTNFDPQTRPGPWLGAAREVLAAAVQTQLAQGNYSKASEALFGLGAFLLRLGEVEDAQIVLQRGVVFAIRSTRFDIAAMSHLWLGLVAREQNDPETFRDEIQRARIMAEISDDPSVNEAIERILSPSEDEPPPTKLL